MKFNQTHLSSQRLASPALVWCLFMPIIHLISLLSNIICISIFSSKTFIQKPIAIYFIGLLVSDSITLLIGYTEMLDRESHMIDKSFVLCLFNEKVIHSLTDRIYTFMEKFCLEWMLYKVLWTRASTILLAILSIQRTRTFFSLSYRETRLCAILACFASIFIATLITCLEWIGVNCEKSSQTDFYFQVFHQVQLKSNSRQFYLSSLLQHYNQSDINYSCLIESFDLRITQSQFNCTNDQLANEFYYLTQSFLSNRQWHLTDSVTQILSPIFHEQMFNSSFVSGIQSAELLVKFFEKRTCQLSLKFAVCLKIFDFLHSLKFSFNRHTLAIFFGNALPSFVVFLANLLSIKVIFCSNSLKYLQETSRNTPRKRRLQNDLRAFLVILIESFSIITISWGIPIFLTMYHCQSLYVVSIATCPRIKRSLAIFLFTDLFNSSTNSFLYSLSGKLFRRQFLSMIKSIVTCGRGHLWHGQSKSLPLRTTGQPDSDQSTRMHLGIQSRAGSFLLSNHQLHRTLYGNLSPKLSDDDRSLSLLKREGESVCNVSLNSDQTSRRYRRTTLVHPRTIKSFFLQKIHFIHRRQSDEERIRLKQTNHRRQSKKSDQQPESNSSLSQSQINPNYSSTQIAINSTQTTTMTLVQNVTTL